VAQNAPREPPVREPLAAQREPAAGPATQRPANRLFKTPSWSENGLQPPQDLTPVQILARNEPDRSRLSRPTPTCVASPSPRAGGSIQLSPSNTCSLTLVSRILSTATQRSSHRNRPTTPTTRPRSSASSTNTQHLKANALDACCAVVEWAPYRTNGTKKRKSCSIAQTCWRPSPLKRMIFSVFLRYLLPHKHHHNIIGLQSQHSHSQPPTI
jgi:hypothetical protein